MIKRVKLSFIRLKLIIIIKLRWNGLKIKKFMKWKFREFKWKIGSLMKIKWFII